MSESPLIFIAYAGPDRPRAIALHGALRAAGLRPWCDAIDLVPGDLWDEVIPARLREAQVILVLVSKTTHDGWYAREEVASAIAYARRDRSRRVVPVLLDGATAEQVPYGLGRISGVEVKGEAFAPVVDGLARIVGAPPGAAPPVEAPPEPAAAPARPEVDVDAVVDAAVNRSLDLGLLTSWLPRGLVARLPRRPSYFEQVVSDVTLLVQSGRLESGEWAIAVWLRQAERLAGPFAEARVFRRELERLPP